MPGIPREVIEHNLKIYPDATPVRQKPRIYPEWLAKPVVIPKANGKVRMCIDYTNLNKACPRDPYPLPHIDQIVDSTSECDLLSFLDAYSGFHQI
jgi:hypothetical protein